MERFAREGCGIGGCGWFGLDDGRVELDSNRVENLIRPHALTRKNALFAGSDRGGEHWAIIASLPTLSRGQTALERIDKQTIELLSAALTRLQSSFGVHVQHPGPAE